MKEFLPEGSLLNTPENKRLISTKDGLREAHSRGVTIESICILCDSDHNMSVDLCGAKGVITREEGALGISGGTTRDIALISRVFKPVCFKVTDFTKEGEAILSRRAAQEETVTRYLSKLRAGDIIPAKVTRLERFGCFADVGCGVTSLIPIDSVSVSRISHSSERFVQGESIYAAVKVPWRESENRITLTHRELLGTWEENAVQFSPRETVPGIIRSVEEYGIFVELAPNLAGLAETHGNACVNRLASVYIKAIIPEKMKIKLSVVDLVDTADDFPPFSNSQGYSQRPYPGHDLNYYITDGHIDKWQYSPPACDKLIQTIFT